MSRKVDDLHQKLEEEFSWREFFVSLYDALHEQSNRISDIEKDIINLQGKEEGCIERLTKKQDKHFARLTWVASAIFGVYTIMLVAILNMHSNLAKEVYRNTGRVENLELRVDMQGKTTIDTYEAAVKELEHLQQEINWIRDNMTMRSRGATIQKK